MNPCKAIFQKNDKTVVMRADDKGYSVVSSLEHQDKIRLEDVSFPKNILIDLVERSNRIFKRLCSHKLMSEK